MTYQTAADKFAARIPARGQVNATAPFLTARRALGQLGAMMSRMGTAILTAGENTSRMKQFEALQGKSDAELAALGLRRDQIAVHVFRDLFYN